MQFRPIDRLASKSIQPFTFGYSSSFVDILDPHVTSQSISHFIMMNIFDPLVYLRTSGEFAPGLAESCDSEELITWTCTLREGVTFHDGSTLDAGDVVLSYAVMWDRLHPLHKGRQGTFTYWSGTWGGFLNPAPPAA